MFKQLYSPQNDVYERVFAVLAPVNEELFFASQGMIGGNYYLTGTRMNEDLQYSSGKQHIFERFTGEELVYRGKSTSLRLYPSGSAYEAERWCVAVLMPEPLLTAAVRGNSWNLIGIIGLLLLFSLAASILLSRHYLRPVTRALNSIRSNNYTLGKESSYTEISDLFDFLAEKDQEYAAEKKRLTALKPVEIDPVAYQHFLSQLGTLTPKEREVFGLYLEGRSAKEIVVLLGFSENALKYHNKNIYSKLEVSSRKQLLQYAAKMKEEETINEKSSTKAMNTPTLTCEKKAVPGKHSRWDSDVFK